jgi:excisionase family DNA binding protein
VTSRLLTAREVALDLGVSVESVLRWARRGDLPAVYLTSRAIRFRPEELDAWLESRAAPARGAPTTPTGAALRAVSSVGPTTPDHEEPHHAC